MKKFSFTLVALVVAALSYAQNTLVATLSHGEDITMYYGTYALRDAVKAAVSGDVINLSGGAFQAVHITKGITLRGTGIDDASPSYISGDFTIQVLTNDANRLSMEGIRCTGEITMDGVFNSPYFVKCQFYYFNYSDNSTIKNAMFANCKITHGYYLRGSSTVQFLNSYVGIFSNYDKNNTEALFVNCVIRPGRNENDATIYNSQLQNCIIYQTYESYNINVYLPSNTIATNCIAIGYSYLFARQVASTGNWNMNRDAFGTVFKDFTGSYSNAQTFELADDAKTKYIGTDGSEVGLHGGIMPYNSTPSYPQFTKMDVPNKTTADGKLSVEIEVSAAE